jgi:hypothetical protein
MSPLPPKPDASTITVRNRASGHLTNAMSHDLFVDVRNVNALKAAVKAALDPEGFSVVSVECAADEILPFAAFLDAPPNYPVRDRG